MVRASIRAFLVPYVEQLGQELGTDDPTEIIHAVLLEHKRSRQGCECRDRSACPTNAPATASTSGSELDELSQLLA